MDGVLNINKPAAMTSHDVVDKLRRILREKKAGHTGTLDPDATGVLPVCLGKATKIIQFIQDDEKGYEGTIVLGIATDTLDASGNIVSISDVGHIKPDDVERVSASFVGDIEQIPPMVSAIKFQGQRLYKLARQGKTVNRAPRRVHIHVLELSGFRTSERDTGLPDVENPVSCIELDFRVRCSKGTYIRSLAADIGSALGCGAYLSRLVRTKSGIFELKDSVKLEEIQAAPQKAAKVIRDMDDVLSNIPVITVSDSAGRRFLNGVPVSRAEVVGYKGEFIAGDVVRIHDEAGALLGLGKTVSVYNQNSEVKPDNPQAIVCKVEKVLKGN